jgi:AcrR family transcriptional regulator
MSLRETILTESRSMMIREGFANLSMRKIATEVGVTATSIYLHFKNKEDLLYALMDESITDLNNNLQLAAESGSDPLESLEAVARTYIEFGLAHPQEYEMVFLVRAEELPRYPKDKFREARRGYEILASLIRDGIEAGLLDDDDPLTSAYTIWAQMHGVVSVILNRRLDTRIKQKDFINNSIEHIIQGFLARRTPV